MMENHRLNERKATKVERSDGSSAFDGAVERLICSQQTLAGYFLGVGHYVKAVGPPNSRQFSRFASRRLICQ